MTHRHKDEKEIEILKECITECNKLPNRSPKKRELWAKYAQILTENGYPYTVEEVRIYYNNRKDDGKVKPQKSDSSLSQTPKTPKTPQTPQTPQIQSLPAAQLVRPPSQQLQTTEPTSNSGQLFSPTIQPSFIQQPPIQNYSSQPPIHNFSQQPPIQNYSSQPPIQNYSTQSPIQNYSTQPPIQNYSTQSPIQNYSTQSPIQNYSSQSPIQNFSTQPPTQQVQFTQPSDLFQRTFSDLQSPTPSFTSIPPFSPFGSPPQSPVESQPKPPEESIPSKSEENKNENETENKNEENEEEEEPQTKPKSRIPQRYNSTSAKYYRNQPHLLQFNNSAPMSMIDNEYSPSSSATIVPYDDQADELIDKLLDVPQISDELSQESYDELKFDLYNRLDNYQSIIGRSYNYYKSKIIPFDQSKLNEMLLDLQELVEEKFIQVLNIFHEKLSISQIYSADKDIERINPPKNSRTISRTTRSYNKEDEVFTFSSSSSEINPTAQGLQSSADTCKSEEDKNNEIIIEPYFKKHIIERFNKNPKIVNMFTGKFDKNTAKSIVIRNTEYATIVSYKKEDCENGFVCDFAYVKFDINSYVLHFRDLKVETGFFLPAKTMYFHRNEEENTNKLYICADLRIKEFQINGLDSEEKEIEIINTNTFYFGESYYISAVITVWDDELVFGCNSSIFFWDLNNDKSKNKLRTKFRSKENINKAKSSSVDIEKVDWNEGKLYKDNEINIETMEKITSLAVINSSTSENLLAVASNIYPVIFIYNKKHQNVFRLISHTMGITSLKCFNNNLISGSLDLKAKFWDIKECKVTKLFNSLDLNITALDADMYCNNVILFTGGEYSSKFGKPYNSSVIASSITDKKAMFEIQLENNFIPNEIAFIPGKNQNGEFARLVIISYKKTLDAQKTCKIQFLDFN